MIDRTIRQKFVWVGAVAAALASAACPGMLDDPARFADGAAFDALACAQIPTTLFATTCVKSGVTTQRTRLRGSIYSPLPPHPD